jgi:2-dehydro-3-deoxyphosphogluconate aldolase/(4S)-4-hydroxy-2-oxoglutarate aldolase
MSSFSWKSYNSMPVVGIIRNLPAGKIPGLAEVYAASGFTTLEVTMNSPSATSLIKELAQQYDHRLNIGAGTVCTPEELEQALAAGAAFIVTPVLNEFIIKQCVQMGVPIIPGAYTPTEIYNAWSWGASMVKVFPATKLGPSYIKDVLAPMNYLKLVPTGGVDLSNFTEFFAAGAAGVGLGSHLFPRQLIEEGRWDELKTIFQSFYNKYTEFRNLTN